MSSGIAVVLILLGHVLADFYMQSRDVAQRKREKPRYMLVHCLLYAACMLLFSIFVFSWTNFLWAWLLIAGSHALIDVLKARYEKRGRVALVCFCVDQVLHVLACIVVTIVAFDGNPVLDVAPVIGGIMGVESATQALIVTLSLLVACRPTGILVQFILEYMRLEGNPDGDVQEEGTQKAGRWIGILERIIIVVLTLSGEFGAIAFVLTAKSIARFKRLDDKEFAECYLVGTLASTAFAIVFSLVIQGIAGWR